jgi:hypothetical protein
MKIKGSEETFRLGGGVGNRCRHRGRLIVAAAGVPGAGPGVGCGRYLRSRCHAGVAAVQREG